MLIRPAVPADWPEIWPFFRSIVAAGDTYAIPDDITSDEGFALWFDPSYHVVVAVSEESDGERSSRPGVILGTAKTGPNRPARGAHVATASFMVSPAAVGRGVGRALGSHIVEYAAGAGYSAMQFNAVVETNTAAVRLWESLGFMILTSVPEAFDHPTQGLVGLHIMHRRLGADAASV